MNICVNVIIEYGSPFENSLDFLRSLEKTQGDFSVCVINNSGRKIIEKFEKFKEFHVVNNNVDVGFVIGANQSFHLTSQFDYSFFVNAKHAFVVKEDWMFNSLNSLEEKAIGGCLYPAKITNSEKVRKILYALSPDGLDWLSEWVNRYMVLPYVNSNIFLIKNEALKSVAMPNSKCCDASTYGLFLSLSFMRNGIAPVALPMIYSSDADNHRHDIFSKIRDGAGIVYPVVIDSVREKFK